MVPWRRIAGAEMLLHIFLTWTVCGRTMPWLCSKRHHFYINGFRRDQLHSHSQFSLLRKAQRPYQEWKEALAVGKQFFCSWWHHGCSVYIQRKRCILTDCVHILIVVISLSANWIGCNRITGYCLNDEGLILGKRRDVSLQLHFPTGLGSHLTVFVH
jgi:hypothetical protein